MKENYLLHIAETLVEQRKQSGKSQEDLAKYCGVSKSSVSKWENGTTRPSICQLPKRDFSPELKRLPHLR